MSLESESPLLIITTHGLEPEHNFKGRTNIPEREIEAVNNFLDHMEKTFGMRPIRKARKETNSGSSYGWKHHVEKYMESVHGTGCYVSNGAFIRVAHDRGYTHSPPKPCRPGSPNALLLIPNSYAIDEYTFYLMNTHLKKNIGRGF